MIENKKSIAEIAFTGLIGALLAASFNIIRFSRSINGKEFKLKKFIVGVTSAGALGCIAAWCLDALNINSSMSAAIIAILGYIGGPLLDLLYDEICETAKIFFDEFQKKIKYKK